jgi:hypothetical protein
LVAGGQRRAGIEIGGIVHGKEHGVELQGELVVALDVRGKGPRVSGGQFYLEEADLVGTRVVGKGVQDVLAEGFAGFRGGS